MDGFLGSLIILILTGFAFISYNHPRLSLKIIGITFGIVSFCYFIFAAFFTGENNGFFYARAISTDSVMSKNISIDTIRDLQTHDSLQIVDKAKNEATKEIANKIQKRKEEVMKLLDDSNLYFLFFSLAMIVFAFLSGLFSNKTKE